MWVSDYYEDRQFKKINPDGPSLQGHVGYPGGWTRATGLAFGDGQWFATRYNSSYRNRIYRLNPASGSVVQSFSVSETFYPTKNHISYGDGGVWAGGYECGGNLIKKMDPALGRTRRKIQIPGWNSDGYINDQSFAANDTQIWALTYKHDYHVTGETKRWIHLLDVGTLPRVSESPDGGTLVADGSSDLNVIFDARGAVSEIHQASIEIESNGGTATKSYMFVVHAPGANSTPTANAGSDQALDATGPTTPVTLDASGSTDPNGDALACSWRRDGEELATGMNPTLDLEPGIYDLLLIVDDLRGGQDTDTMRVTVHAPAIEVDDLVVVQVEGGGIASGEVVVRNSGDKTLNWTVSFSSTLPFSKTATSGSTVAGGTSTFTVSLDTTGLSVGVYRLVLVFTSNDPVNPVYEKEVVFVVHEDAPNNPPVADAGPDREESIWGATGPFVIDLSGDSTDPDGDYLKTTWTIDGEPLIVSEAGVVEIGGGTHTLTLTVDDYRGGVDSDDRLFTVHANTPLEGWRAWYGSDNRGWTARTETDWVKNWPPIVAWSRADINGGGYAGNSSPVVSEGRVYYAGGRGMFCVDEVTGTTVWSKGWQGGNPTPCIDDDNVYAISKGSGGRTDLACWDKVTGALKWKKLSVCHGADADGSGDTHSPMVYGDLLFASDGVFDKRSGDRLGDNYGKLAGQAIFEICNWQGRSYVATGHYGDSLCELATGAYTGIEGGESLSIASGSIFWGDKVWKGSQIKTIAPYQESTVVTVDGYENTENYIHPIVIGDYGYYKKGQHGAGGSVNAVDMNAAREVWGGKAALTFIGVGDKLVCQGGGRAWIVQAGVPDYEVTHNAFTFDTSGNGYALPAYDNERLYLIAGQGLTCLYVGLAAPVLAGDGATWDPATGIGRTEG